MDTAHWPQEIVVKPIEEIVTKPAAAAATGGGAGGGLENRKTRPQKEQVLNCPRCNSTNTKFCYYNNYSLTQPRYFCKTCRRYWTEGGSLRNIPVGGGSRKNKRSSSSHSSPSTSSSYNNNSSSKKLLTDSHHIQDHDHQNPNKMSMIQDQQGQDLNLAFPSTTSTTTPTHQAAGMIRSFSELMQLPNIINDNNSKNQISAMELLTGISSASRGLSSFPMQDPTNNMVFTSGFPTMNHQDFKPSLNFSLDGIENSATGSYGTSTLHGVQESSSNGIRSLFPFEDLKNVSSTTTTTAAEAAADHHIDHNQQISREHGGDHSGYWTGMLGGGSW